jgi:SAM-dependent methyltransferase
MAVTPAEFYNNLAAEYHLIFEDWESSMARQAAALAPVLERTCGSGARILDCACGIGTQTLGLAGLGFRVAGSDASAMAIERARNEAAIRGLEIPLFHADMRQLSAIPGDYDAVIAMDNALPHLESDMELRRAAEAIHAKLRPGGLFLASIRDYDRLIVERPTVQGPAFHSDSGRRRIVFQLWDWLDERRYAFHLYITREMEGGWQTHHGVSTYRALLRDELSEILRSAGFVEVRWQMPEESGYYQSMVSGYRPPGL